MPKTKEQNQTLKEATMAKINEAALKLFAQKGLAATGAGEIAKAAGVSVGLMYHYYTSKEELYAALVRSTLSEANNSIKQIHLLKVAPEKQIQMITDNFMKDLASKKSLASYYFMLMTQVMLNKEPSEAVKKQMKGLYESPEIIEKIIKKGQDLGQVKKGNPRALTIMYLAAFNGLCSYKFMMGNKFIVPEAEWINQVLLEKKTK